jgi:hypothetical protein
VTRKGLSDLIRRAGTAPALTPVQEASRNITLRQQEAERLRQRYREAREWLEELRQKLADADRRVSEAHREYMSVHERRALEIRREDEERKRRHEVWMRQPGRQGNE